MSERLRHSVCVVTGGGSGIGRAVVLALVTKGAAVAFCGRNSVALEETAALARELPNARVLSRVVDIGVRDQVVTFVSEVVQEFGAPDVLINNAGLMLIGPVNSGAFASYERMISANLTGAISLTTAVIAYMPKNKGGIIINLSSIASRITGPGLAVYGATKSGLDAFTSGLRGELAAAGIRVCSLQLGAVQTNLNDKIEDLGMRRFIKARSKNYTEMQPSAVADVILQMIELPHTMNMASVFLVPTDQVS